MSLLEALSNLFDKDAEHLYAGWVDPARVDRQLNPAPLQAGLHYVRLWLAEMHLKDEVKWMQTLQPVVHSLARFDFGDRPVEVPNVADPSRLGAQSVQSSAVIARNFQLTPTLPFNGGTFTLEAGLLALPGGDNYLKSFLDVMGKFAGLLNVPQLSAALSVAQPLALGLQQLLGPGGGKMHLGFRESFTGGGISDGYLAAVRAPERDVPPLYVVNGQLRTGSGLGAGQHRPLEGFDYMLFRVEVFDRRDDWEQLASIQEPFQEAVRDLADMSEERAVFNLRRAMLRARLSPELTSTDRGRVVEALRQKFTEAQAGFGGKSGLTGGGPVTLAHAMTYAKDPRDAFQDPLPSVEEIFDSTSGLVYDSRKTTAAMMGGPRGGAAAPPGEGSPADTGGEPELPPAERGFFFTLDGNDVSYGAARCGAEFDFVFNYDAPPKDLASVLAILSGGAELEDARRKDATLGLSLVTRGFTIPDGVWTKTFKFNGGALDEAVRFHLKADREPVEDSGLHVTFERDGCVLYEFPVPIRLVRTGEELKGVPARAPLAIDLDEVMEMSELERREAKLVIAARADRLSVSFDNEDTGETFTFEPNLISRSSLAGLLMKTRAELGEMADHTVWGKIEDPFNPPADPGIRRGLDKCLRLAAQAGAYLHTELSADPQFADLLKKIDGLPVGTLLSIRTDCAYLPWELIYPGKFQADGEAAPQAQQFWGNRFAIECLQTGMGKQYKTPIRLHRASRARFTFNLNPTIDEAFAGKPFQPVASHSAFGKRLSESGVAVEFFEKAGDIRKLLRSENDSTLLYFYCHGQNDKPLADDHAEKLELDRDEYLEPRHLDDGVVYPRGPLVFLNSCSSGGFSPLGFSTFLTRFRDKQALGLITTSFTIPAAFAAVFGQRLIERYVAGERLGRALLALRRDLLQVNVPLGLFYSLHCPGDITIGKGGS